MMQGSLASRLRLLRVQRGLTLQEASDEIGIDRHTLSSIERGTQTPHAPTLKKIAEGYDVAIENLLVQDDLAEKPVEAPTSPKVEAPTSSEPSEEAEESEERREELSNIRAALLEAHNLFEEWAGTYKDSGDKKRLKALRSAVALSSLGAAQLVEEDVDVDRDYELGAQDVVAELNRLGSLSEVLEVEEEAEEEAEGGVVVLADFKARQRRRIAAS